MTDFRFPVPSARRMLAAGAIFLLSTLPAISTELEVAGEAGFTEQFSGNTQVSGQFLSGLAFSSTAQTLNLEQFRLSFSGQGNPSLVCVRLTSEDGRYFAANLYRAKGAATADHPGVPVPTSYGDQLKNYGTGGLLVLAAFSEKCQETSGKVYVPGVFGDRGAERELLAYINVSQGRVRAALTDAAGKTAAEASCSKPKGGAKVTYSHLCRLPLDAAAANGLYTLKVEVKGLTGQARMQDYAVHIE